MAVRVIGRVELPFDPRYSKGLSQLGEKFPAALRLGWLAREFYAPTVEGVGEARTSHTKNSPTRRAPKNRVLRDGDPIKIIYPSGRKVAGKVTDLPHGRSVVEGVQADTAAWVAPTTLTWSGRFSTTSKGVERITHHPKGVKRLKQLLGA